jgi:hypothetical protein
MDGDTFYMGIIFIFGYGLSFLWTLLDSSGCDNYCCIFINNVHLYGSYFLWTLLCSFEFDFILEMFWQNCSFCLCLYNFLRSQQVCSFHHESVLIFFIYLVSVTWYFPLVIHLSLLLSLRAHWNAWSFSLRWYLLFLDPTEKFDTFIYWRYLQYFRPALMWRVSVVLTP